MDVLVATGLEIGRTGLPVQSGLELALAPGELVRLTGPNGVGKSTLLRTLARLLPPLAGRIERRGDLIFSGHSDGVKSALTVVENLSFFNALRGGADAALDRALSVWHLTELAGRRAADLSAGQRRRLSLARLSLAPAPLWLLDEPTASLDTATTALFEEVLASHLAEGGAAVIATHLPIRAPNARDLALAPRTARIVDLEALW